MATFETQGQIRTVSVDTGALGLPVCSFDIQCSGPGVSSTSVSMNLHMDAAKENFPTMNDSLFGKKVTVTITIED